MQKYFLIEPTYPKTQLCRSPKYSLRLPELSVIKPKLPLADTQLIEYLVRRKKCVVRH
jgi:hypothetical protein